MMKLTRLVRGKSQSNLRKKHGNMTFIHLLSCRFEIFTDKVVIFELINIKLFTKIWVRPECKIGKTWVQDCLLNKNTIFTPQVIINF